MAQLILPPGQNYKLPTCWLKRGKDMIKINAFEWPKYERLGWSKVSDQRGSADAETVEYERKQHKVEDVRRRTPGTLAHGDEQRAQESRTLDLRGTQAGAALAATAEAATETKPLSKAQARHRAKNQAKAARKAARAAQAEPPVVDAAEPDAAG